MSKLRRVQENARRGHYSRFSEQEMKNRRKTVREMMQSNGLDALLVYGDAGFHQTNISYLTNYRPPFSTYLVFFQHPSEPSTLFVGISNQIQYVREKAEIEDLRLMLPDPAGNVADRLHEADRSVESVGIVGSDPRYDLSIPFDHRQTLENELTADLVDVTPEFIRTISVRSDEEIDRIQKASEIIDSGMQALVDSVEPGVTEQELGDVFRTTCLRNGGDTGAKFIASASMSDPGPAEGLPWKMPSSREVEQGDIITTELGCTYGGYPSQIHRPFSVDEEPADRYEEIFSVTYEIYENLVDALKPGSAASDVHEALAPVEESEYKIYDVVVHGYGIGYTHPFIGTEDSNYWPEAEDPITADWEFKENMVVAIQPNVITEDERYGLQFGTTAVISDGGAEPMHEFPEKFMRV